MSTYEVTPEDLAAAAARLRAAGDELTRSTPGPTGVDSGAPEVDEALQQLDQRCRAAREASSAQIDGLAQALQEGARSYAEADAHTEEWMRPTGATGGTGAQTVPDVRPTHGSGDPIPGREA